MNESELTESEHSSSQTNVTQLTPKTTIPFNNKIFTFFYYQSHLICKGTNQVIVYNTLTCQSDIITTSSQDFILQQLPPYLFTIIEGQFLKLYGQEELKNEKEVVVVKISKLEPQSICRFNKGYFMGGYNKSILPGHKRSIRRSVYYIEKLIAPKKNTPDWIIKLKDSDTPISHVKVQNPYLMAYCRPTLYLITLQHRQIVLTFEKDATDLIVLEGRFATSCLNGIGLSVKGTIFTFDVQRFPLYGVEITEHLHQSQCLCLQKTGRIFGGRENSVFQYHPFKKHSKCWIMYGANERVIWISCTPNNSLMVLRTNQKEYLIEVYSLQ